MHISRVPMCPAGPAAQEEQGAPGRSRHEGCVAGGCRTQLSRLGGGTLMAEEGHATPGPVKVICATSHRCTLSPVHSFLLFSGRSREPRQGRNWQIPRQLVAIRKRVTKLQAVGELISRETDRDCSGTFGWTPSPGQLGPAFCTSTPTRANTRAATRRVCPKAALASSWTGSAP